MNQRIGSRLNFALDAIILSAGFVSALGLTYWWRGDAVIALAYLGMALFILHLWWTRPLLVKATRGMVASFRIDNEYVPLLEIGKVATVDILAKMDRMDRIQLGVLLKQVVDHVEEFCVVCDLPIGDDATAQATLRARVSWPVVWRHSACEEQYQASLASR